MAKKSTPQAIDLDRSVRIGEQTETITVELDDAEVELEQVRVLDLLARRENLQQAIASIKTDYKAKIGHVDKGILDARKAATTRKREQEVIVEEWLRGSQVFRVRADTGEVLGQRAATSAERQESMFSPDSPKAADHFPDQAFDAT